MGVIWHPLLAIGPKSISEIKPALLHIWNEITKKCVKLSLIRFSFKTRIFIVCNSCEWFVSDQKADKIVYMSLIVT